MGPGVQGGELQGEAHMFRVVGYQGGPKYSMWLIIAGPLVVKIMDYSEVPGVQCDGLQGGLQVLSVVAYREGPDVHCGGLQRSPLCAAWLITCPPPPLPVIRVVDDRDAQGFGLVDDRGASGIQRSELEGRPQVFSVVDERGGPRCSRCWITGVPNCSGWWITGVPSVQCD